MNLFKKLVFFVLHFVKKIKLMRTSKIMIERILGWRFKMKINTKRKKERRRSRRRRRERERKREFPGKGNKPFDE